MAPSAIHEIPIIDVDTHYNEPHDLWTSRAPARLRDRVPQVKNVNGIDSWVVERDAVLFPYSGVCVIRRDGSKMYGELSLRPEIGPGDRRRVYRARAAQVEVQRYALRVAVFEERLPERVQEIGRASCRERVYVLV